MATLTGSTIAATYEQLIKLDTETLGDDASAKWLETGKAENLPISVSTHRVGIGTVTPSYELDLAQSHNGSSCTMRIGNTSNTTGSDAELFIENGGSSGGDPKINLQIDGVLTWGIGVDNDDYDKLKFGTSTTVGGNTKLTLQTDGKLGLGVTDPDTILEVNVNDTYIHCTDSGDGGNSRLRLGDDSGNGGYLAIYKDDETVTCRIRSYTISSCQAFFTAGRVGIGMSDPSNQLHVKVDDASSFAGRFHNDGNNSNRYGVVISAGTDGPSSAGDCQFLHFHDGDGTARGGIRSSSDPNVPEIFNGSDKRMKKDIAPTTIKGLDSINALTLSEWNWNHPTIVNPKQDIGIVADDLEKVFPELISKGKLAGWDDVATDLKQVPSETKLTFVLIKAVQELSAKVTALESK